MNIRITKLFVKSMTFLGDETEVYKITGIVVHAEARLGNGPPIPLEGYLEGDEMRQVLGIIEGAALRWWGERLTNIEAELAAMKQAGERRKPAQEEIST